MDFYVWDFLSSIAMDFTQLILQQGCKMFTGTGMTFQEAFIFNAILYKE